MRPVGVQIGVRTLTPAAAAYGARAACPQQASVTLIGTNKTLTVDLAGLPFEGRSSRTESVLVRERVDDYLMRLLRRKYRRRRAFLKARACWRRTTRQYPRLFALWAWCVGF
jgi:hypothetical protein